MGLMMTIQLFLAFTSVSALPLFWLERPLYAYEASRSIERGEPGPGPAGLP